MVRATPRRAPSRPGGEDRLRTSLGGMSWHWRLEDASGAALDPADVGVEMPGTDNQGDAESWLGEHWRDLLSRGVVWYGVSRATMVRRWRFPKPEVRVGAQV